MTRAAKLAAPLLVGMMLVGACSSGADETATPQAAPVRVTSTAPTPSVSPSPTPTTPTPQPTEIRAVPMHQWRAMREAGMVRRGCPVTQRDQLRRVDVDFVNFKGDLRRGHLVVNADVAPSVARIFTRLREEEFPIRRMVGVEHFGGDVARSLAADNTSAYNCRQPNQINAPFMESPHANGRAIDINPVENPWKDLRCKCWTPDRKHAPRTPGPGKILRGGTVWQVFHDEGWVWQDIKVADYMHFDSGYPSRTVHDDGHRIHTRRGD